MNWRRYGKSKTVGQQQAKATKAIESLRKQGKKIVPVIIEGRIVAITFWGKAWCTNLESYQDYASRLPRGRSYVRHGSVLDLKINPGVIEALVQGSSRYRVRIDIKPMSAAQWHAFKQGTQGHISSVIALLNGELPESVLEQIIAPNTGLFPKPAEISLTCNCPDWAVMCKHVAAALYGVGHRLDTEPELLFSLRNVNSDELISHLTSVQSITGGGLSGDAKAAKRESTPEVADGLLGEIFGIDLSDSTEPPPGPNARPRKKVAGAKVVGKKVTSKKLIGKKVMSKKVVSKKVASKKSVSKDATSKKLMSKKAVSKKVTSKKSTSKKATSKKSTSKKATSKKATSKKSTSNNITSKKPTNKNITGKKSTNKRAVGNKEHKDRGD